MSICQMMLNNCQMTDDISYELIAEMSDYHKYAGDDTMTELFQQFVCHTDIDLKTDLIEDDWLGEVVHLKWHRFVYERLLESRCFKPINELLRQDPTGLMNENLLHLMTVHGLTLDAVRHAGQHAQNWLMHAFLGQASSRCQDLVTVEYLIRHGADPLSVVHGRMALTTIFATTNLGLHLKKFGRNRSIFAAWQELLEQLSIDFSKPRPE